MAQKSKAERYAAINFNVAMARTVVHLSEGNAWGSLPVLLRNNLAVKNSKERLNVARVFNAAKERTADMYGKANASEKTRHFDYSC